MATIQEVFAEIEQFQKAIASEGGEGLRFKIDLINFTTVLYFDYLGHAILGSQRANLSGKDAPSSQKEYYRLLDDKTVLNEYIRVNGIGHLFHVWVMYEHFIRNKFSEVFGTAPPLNISNVFTQLIQRLKIVDITVVEEFDVMRNTRNSLHDGGKFNASHKAWSGKLSGTPYHFAPGEEVKPLRVLDVVKAVWRHFKIIEGI